MADNEEQLLKEAKKLSWEDRLAHKNWKVRQDAYSDIASNCEASSDPKDPKLKEYGPLMRKIVADANAAAQERGLDALLAYLEHSDVDAGRYAKDVCNVLVQKCFTGRTKTIQKATDAFLMFIELEAQEAAFEAMLKGFEHKLAKVIVPVVDAIYAAINSFGTRVVDAKMIMKALVPPENKKDPKTSLFEHPDAKVRASAKGLTVELCRWVSRPVVQNVLVEKMRDAMKKEMEGELEKVPPGVPIPSRRIRSEQDKVDIPVEAGGAASPSGKPMEVEAVPQIDEYDMYEPVDILSQIKPKWFEAVKATKWSDRKDAVTELVTLASAKRLQPGDYTEVNRCLRKLIADVNVVVCVEAITATANLARGLRKEYSGGARGLLPALLERFKEKKANVVKAIQESLQAMHTGGSINLGDSIEEIKGATKHKVPSVRSETVGWIAFCLENSNRATVTSWHKALVPVLIETLSDGDQTVRDNGFSALAAIGKSMGMGPLKKELEKMDEVKKKKLQEMVGDGSAAPGEASTSSGPASTSANGPAASRKSAASAFSSTRPAPALSKAPSKKVDSGKPSGAKKESKATGGGSKPAAVAAVDNDDDLQVSDMSIEELETKVAEIVKPEVLANLKNAAAWKERLEGVVALTESVKAMGEGLEAHTELLVRLLVAVPGWNEKNFQVSQRMFELLAYLSQSSKSFSRKCVVLCLPVVEKIADMKLRLQSCACLTAFCEAVGPHFVFKRLYTLAKEQKNIKVHSESLAWMAGALDDFGTSLLQLKPLIDFCIVSLESSNAPVRTAAIKLLGVLHKFKGPDLEGFLTSVKPALMSAIKDEFVKNPYEGPSAGAPKKAVRAEAVPEAGPSGGDDLPREDISGKLTEAYLKDFLSADWKTRQAAIASVDQTVEEAHRRVQATGTGDLFTALQGRLSDSNKNLVTAALGTLANLAKAIGPGVDKASRGILTAVLKTLTDNKKPLREAVGKLLDAWVDLVGLEKMVPYFLTALVDPKLSADGRKDLFLWLAKHIPKCSATQELVQLVKPGTAGLQEKTAEVRKAAEEMVTELLKACGVDAIAKEAKGLPAGALAVLNPLLEKARSAGGQTLAAEDSASSLKGVKLPRPTTAGSSRPKSTIPRPGAVRPGSAPKTTKQLQEEANEAALAGEALIAPNDGKDERARKAPRRIKFDDRLSDEAEDIQAASKPLFRSDLQKRLFGTDFKEQVKGLEQLQKAVPERVKALADNLDILLRWSVLRLCESNTASLVKTVEFLTVLFEALKAEDYALSEYEASIFLPCLVEKLGQNSAQVREKMQRLVRAVVCIYPASKMVGYLVEGIKSKNSKTKLDCLEEINAMVERNGLEVAGPSKALHQVAGLVLEKDNQIRNKALDIAATVYKIAGGDALKFFGKVSEQQKALLEEKFKWKAKDMEKKKEGKPGEARAAMRASRVLPEASVPASDASEPESSAPSTPRDIPEDTSARPSRASISQWPSNGPPSSSGDVSAIPRAPSFAYRPPQTWAEAYRHLREARSQDEAVDAMKVICHELSSAASMATETSMQEYKNDVDGLVQTLRQRVADTFRTPNTSSRGCKYVLNTLMQTFQVAPLAPLVSAVTLKELVAELLSWLLDDNVGQMDDGQQLIRALNVLMLKILENADRTHSFCVLIQLLQDDKILAENGTVTIVPKVPRFLDLVVKCLIKLTKALPQTVHHLNLDEILNAISKYFENLGMEEIRRRAGADDKPLRMVKTVLHELVKLRGDSIKGNLSHINVLAHPPPIIMAYIDLNLQTIAHSSRLQAPNGTATPAAAPRMPAVPDSSAESTSSSGVKIPHLKTDLAAVFKKIGNKETSLIGLYELYRLIRLHQDIDLDVELAGTSEEFRDYIHEGLAKVEIEIISNNKNPGGAAPRAPPPVIQPFDPNYKRELPEISPSNSNLEPARLPVPNATPPGTPPKPGTDSYREKMAQINAMTSRPVPSEYHPTEHPRRRSSEEQEAAAAVVAAGNSRTASLEVLRERMRNIQAAAAGLSGTAAPLNANHAEGPQASASAVPGTPPRGEEGSEEQRSVTMSSLQARVQSLRDRTEH